MARHASAELGETSQLALDDRLIKPSRPLPTRGRLPQWPHRRVSRLDAHELALSFLMPFTDSPIVAPPRSSIRVLLLTERPV